MIRAVIADDEALARQKLRDFLRDVEDVVCVGEARDGPETLQTVDDLKPDLLFLDIRMPGASGLEVLERLNNPPHVVFTTAYDRYAVTAFELQALDYLLKPFGEERFQRALARVRRALDHPSSLLAERARSALGNSRDEPIRRLFVRERGRIVPVQVDTLEYMEAGDEYVSLHTLDRRYLVAIRLRELETRLDPQRFLRIHRSYIVNLDHVTALTPYDGTRLQVHLRSGRALVASRAKSRDLRRLAV